MTGNPSYNVEPLGPLTPMQTPLPATFTPTSLSTTPGDAEAAAKAAMEYVNAETEEAEQLKREKMAEGSRPVPNRVYINSGGFLERKEALRTARNVAITALHLEQKMEEDAKGKARKDRDQAVARAIRLADQKQKEIERAAKEQRDLAVQKAVKEADEKEAAVDALTDSEVETFSDSVRALAQRVVAKRLASREATAKEATQLQEREGQYQDELRYAHGTDHILKVQKYLLERAQIVANDAKRVVRGANGVLGAARTRAKYGKGVLDTTGSVALAKDALKSAQAKSQAANKEVNKRKSLYQLAKRTIQKQAKKARKATKEATKKAGKATPQHTVLPSKKAVKASKKTLLPAQKSTAFKASINTLKRTIQKQEHEATAVQAATKKAATSIAAHHKTKKQTSENEMMKKDANALTED